MSDPSALSPVATSSSVLDTNGSPSRIDHRKCQEKKNLDVPSTTSCKELQSPPHRGYSRPFELNHGYSPGDVDPTQDIVWDSTSPTHPGGLLKNVQHIEIADIVNRIAPKETKTQGSRSALWHWIGDSPTSLTPERPKTRLRKKSIRQNGVDDLIKLARQFDKYMEQDKEASMQPSENYNHEINKSPAETSSSLNQTEAELRPLFDSSTQKVSGGLSPTSTKSSQDQSQVRKLTSGPKNINDDFDDDWENDGMLDDPSLLAMIHNPDPSAGPVRRSSRGSVRELCPKVKPTLRSTFKLNPKPHLQCPKIEISDWDDCADDVLFYQACDNLESLSQTTESTTTPLPISQMSPAIRKSPRGFIRSNSLPGKTVKTHQESNHAMSRSLPAAESSQVAIKRSVGNTRDKNRKALVTNPMAAKCSAMEIERKKQEALARRRQRMQNTHKL
ncbi:uncharacterized protein etaa1b [Stigmatopora nigra]